MSLIFNKTIPHYIDFGDIFQLTTMPNFTFACWVNVSYNDVAGAIIAKKTNDNANGYRLIIQPTNLFDYHEGGRLTSTTQISLNTWYHVAITRNTTTGLKSIFVNGTLEGTQNIADPGTNINKPFTVGYDTGFPDNGFSGIIDDLRMYDRVLSNNEIETIYSAQGIDNILDGLVLRNLFKGVESETSESLSSITINNPQGGSASNSAKNITLAYTAPTGNNLVLVVIATAEGTNSGRVQPTGITFNGNNLTLVTTTRTTTSPFNGVSMFSKTVVSGESGNIVVTYSRNNNGRTVHAFTLANVNSATAEATATNFNNTGSTTTGLTTLTNGAIVVSGGTNRSDSAMSASGTNHSLSDARIGGTILAGAIGNIPVSIAGSISNIGFTADTMDASAMVLGAFTPLKNPGNIVDESGINNGLSYNFPTFDSTFLKYRRP